MKDFLTRDYAEKEIVWVAGHPLPPAFPMRPVHALKSAIALKNNKEDTSLVYEVTNSVSGGVHIEKFRRFVATDYGRRVVETPIRIEEVLCQRDRLGAMPAGSVGRAFYDFMEGEQLSETALLEATKTAGIDYTVPSPFVALCRQIIHFKVTHDLWHVISGYGRDGLGEICLLKFYNGQWYDRGIELIVKIGSYSMGRQIRDLPMKALLDEAFANARAAEWIMAFDVEAYLQRPLADVRDMMKIKPPTLYHAVADDIKSHLLPVRAELEAAE